MKRLSQLANEEGSFPGSQIGNIKVETPLVGKIDKVLRRMQSTNPAVFNDINFVRVLPSGPYGQWRSNEPNTIYINYSRIRQQMQQGVSEADALEDAINYGLAQVVRHEIGHAAGEEEPGAQRVQQDIRPETFQGL